MLSEVLFQAIWSCLKKEESQLISGMWKEWQEGKYDGRSQSEEETVWSSFPVLTAACA